MFLSPIQLNISTLLCVFSQILLKSTKPVSSGDHYNFIQLGLIGALFFFASVGVYVAFFADEHWKNEFLNFIPGPCDTCKQKIKLLEEIWPRQFFNEAAGPGRTISKLQNWISTCPEKDQCMMYQKLLEDIFAKKSPGLFEKLLCSDCKKWLLENGYKLPNNGDDIVLCPASSSLEQSIQPTIENVEKAIIASGDVSYFAMDFVFWLSYLLSGG